jgi:FtsH-binding integral membrane protein
MSYQNGYAQQMPGNANYQNNYGQQAQQNTSYQNSYGQQGMEGLGGIYGQSYEQHAETINGGRKYIPNIINIIMMVLAVIVVFVPYASLDGKTESIIKVFDVGALVLFVALIAFIADIVCVCIDNKGCFVAAFIISLISGGLLVFEFVLARIDYSKLPENASGQMLWGSWFGLLVGIILIISLPVWKIILNGLNKDKENM